MSEIEDRLARAMAFQHRGGDFWEFITTGHSEYGEDGLSKDDYLYMARAAIEAMREPTEVMVKMAWNKTDEMRSSDDDVFIVAWQAMIDGALK